MINGCFGKFVALTGLTGDLAFFAAEQIDQRSAEDNGSGADDMNVMINTSLQLACRGSSCHMCPSWG